MNKVLVLCLAFAVVEPLVAQGGGWAIRIEPAITTSWGNDLRVGYIFRSYGNATPTTQTYGASYSPIIASAKPVTSWRGEIIRSNESGSISFGIGGWSYDATSFVNVRISSPVGDAHNVYINGCKIWDQTLFPLTNEWEKSGYSPTECSAENRTSLWSADVFFQKNILAGDNGVFGLRVGIRNGEFANHRNERFTDTSFIYHNGDAIFKEYPFAANEHFLNYVTINSKSKSHFGFVGPTFSLDYKTELLGFDLGISATQSFLFGNASTDGNWHDVDEIHAATGALGTRYTVGRQLDLLDGNFPVEENERTFVPATDLRVSLDRHIASIIYFGIGASVSNWPGMPVASKWSVPAQWTIEEGTGWRRESRNIAFGSLSAHLLIKF